MIRKTSGITFDRNEIEKALTRGREASSFWPILDSQSKNTINKPMRKPQRDDINITGSVLKNKEIKE